MSKQKHSIPTPENTEKLRELLAASRFEPLLAFFGGMPEEMRLSLAPVCREWYKSHYPQWSKSLIPGMWRVFSSSIKYDGNPYLATLLGIIATGNKDEVWKAVREIGFSLFIEEEVFKVLCERRPSWMTSLLEKMLQNRNLFMDNAIWRLYRIFVRNHWSEPSYNTIWIPIMFANLNYSTWEESEKSGNKTITERLEDDPDLLKHDIWSLLDIERFPRNFSYTSLDSRDQWKQAYCELIQKGILSEERVFDACFHAFSRPFTDFQMKWFVQLLQYLVDNLPRDDAKLSERSDQFLSLIEHHLPTVAAFGMKISERLFNTGRLSEEKLIDAIPPMLRSPVKGTVKNTISVLEKIAKNRTDLRNRICQAFTIGLTHEAKEIQQKSLEMILKYGDIDDPDLSDSIMRTAPSLVGSVRSRLPTRFQDTVGSNDTEKTPSFCRAETTERQPIPVVAIDSYDELLDSAAALLENSSDATEVERLLDGIARLGAKRPDDFDLRTGPLLKRAFQLIGISYSSDETIQRFHTYLPFDGVDFASDFRYFILGWLTGDMPELVSGQMQIGKFLLTKPFSTEPQFPVLRLLAKRIRTILQRVFKGESFRLLSTPTHVGGWIDPMVFARRLVDDYLQRNQDTVVDDDDRLLALLRLMPEGRKEALRKIDLAVKNRDDYINAVRYALGADDVDIASGTAPQYWIAASRCRYPLEDDPLVSGIFGEYGPDGAIAAEYELCRKEFVDGRYPAFVVETCDAQWRRNSYQVDVLFPTVAFHLPASRPYWEPKGSFGWLLTVWPQNLDAASDLAMKSNVGNLERAAKSEGLVESVVAIRNSSHPIRKMGVWSILTALAMKNGETQTAATDTLIFVISEERLSIATAISAANELLELKLLSTSRWLKAFEIVKEQLPRHADWTSAFIESMVDRIDSKNLGRFLDLLYEILLSRQKTVTSEECREFLKSLSGSGKSAKLAKKLLEL